MNGIAVEVPDGALAVTLMFCQGHPGTCTTLHLLLSIPPWFPVLPRVYHIDSSPSGAGDGADFSKAFTVSRLLFTGTLSSIVASQLQLHVSVLFQATRDAICCITATDKTLIVVRVWPFCLYTHTHERLKAEH